MLMLDDMRTEFARFLHEDPSGRWRMDKALAHVITLAYEAGMKAGRQGTESELERMRHRIECLRGGLKSAAGWLIDADDTAGHEKCIEMAGDMEPPLMVSNDRVDSAERSSRPPGCAPATERR